MRCTDAPAAIAHVSARWLEPAGDRVSGEARGKSAGRAVSPACCYDTGRTGPRAAPLFDAQHTAADILAAAKAKDKALVLVLDGGASYAGKVKEVGDYAVILTELRGKEFFDAWIPLDAIVAMEERVRLR